MLWNQTYGGVQSDRETSLVVTSDGGYAMGGYTYSFGSGSGDFWLVKTDSFGNLQWNKTYGEENHQEEAFAMVTTVDGGYALAGYTSVLVPTNDSDIQDTPVGIYPVPSMEPTYTSEPSDAWLVKTDELGNVEWSKKFGGENIDRVFALVATSDGGYALAGQANIGGDGSGSWLIKTDENGNLQWEKTYGEFLDCAYALVETFDGGYALAGYKYVDEAFYDFCLAKTDAFGNVEWSQTYDGPSYDVAYGLIIASDGGYVLSGYKTIGNDNLDFCLLKTDITGNIEWTKTYGNDVTDIAYSVDETTDGGYLLAGGTTEFDSIQDPDDGKASGFIVKTDPFGNMVWNQIYGGTNTDSFGSIIENFDGGYTIAGSTWSFGEGNADFWLIKIGPHGNIPEFSSLIILPLIGLVSLLVMVYRKIVHRL